ncbi:unnamed protein product [Chrysodeixis includens]|uniref:Uncharacterized protein n=1 Tax=Chrysodeixis includens TaxID=689277 RepID=A0A9N8KUM0_CHRIL|nr:unnamed protein product [Chrysodeixis includens]
MFAVSLVFITIEGRGTPKIEIFEIREADSGLELRNLNGNSRNHQSSDSLLKLLRVPKTENQASKLARQLLNKLKTSLKTEEDAKTNRYYNYNYNDDAHIYILNSDMFDDESSYEEVFIDKTRHERSSDRNELRDFLFQLLQPQKRQKKLRRDVKSPIALSGSSSPRGYKGIEGNKHLFRPGVTLPASVTFPSGISQSTRFFGNKLIIPVLPKPTFKNLEEWRELQKAHYAKRKKVANPAPIIIYVDTPQKATKDKKANTKAVPIQYGDDSFATMMVFP